MFFSQCLPCRFALIFLHFQPECSPQHCLAEHSSPSPGDLTTASATGSPPLISTSLTLGCSSTSTTATATTTICATVKTFSTTVTKTTATPTVSVKVGRSQDPVLQMKPQLQPVKPIPFNGRPKVNLTVNTKTSFEEDKDYILSEVRSRHSFVQGNVFYICDCWVSWVTGMKHNDAPINSMKDLQSSNSVPVEVIWAANAIVQNYHHSNQ